MYLSLYCKGWKRVTQGLRVRGSWRPNRNFNILTSTLIAVNVVSFSFSRRSTGGPGVHSAGCWLSLLHLISNVSGPQTPSGFPRALTAGCGFPYHNSSITPSPTVCNSDWTVLTELYNSSTSTRSPTRSLKWHDWSSSSGNNCHAVHRSLSSGASLCSGTVAPSPCPILSALIRPRDFFRLLASEMCHFLPVHHLEIACLAGRRSKYNTGISLKVKLTATRKIPKKNLQRSFEEILFEKQSQSRRAPSEKKITLYKQSEESHTVEWGRFNCGDNIFMSKSFFPRRQVREALSGFPPRVERWLTSRNGWLLEGKLSSLFEVNDG